MKRLITNGCVMAEVDGYKPDNLIADENIIQTGLMLNSTTDTIDKVIGALDNGLALC